MPRLQLLAHIKQRPTLRYALIVILALALAALIAYDRLHTRERTVADKTVACPALEQGCRVELRDFSYLVRSDAAIELGKPFVVSVEGRGVGVAIRAFWRRAGETSVVAHYRMDYAGPDRWQATMQLPPGQQRDWLLHLELNARAVDITTRVR